MWNTDFGSCGSKQQHPFPYYMYHSNNCGPNGISIYLQDSPEWTTSFRWCCSLLSSPVHLQPTSLCVHKTWSWLRECFRLLLGSSSNLSSLHVGQDLRSACSRAMHVQQKLIPQQLVRCGSWSIRPHIGQCVWTPLAGGSANLQS